MLMMRAEYYPKIVFQRVCLCSATVTLVCGISFIKLTWNFISIIWNQNFKQQKLYSILILLLNKLRFRMFVTLLTNTSLHLALIYITVISITQTSLIKRPSRSIKKFSTNNTARYIHVHISRTRDLIRFVIAARIVRLAYLSLKLVNLIR